MTRERLPLQSRSAQLLQSTLNRNLAALWIAEFTALLGFSLSFPFIPLFLAQDLGIRSRHEVAFWAAIAASVTEFSLAIFAPFWGVLADRFGRKAMLVRAMLGGGISLVLMGLSRSAIQLTGARILEGATSGTVAMASALVSSQSPRAQMARSLGILSSAVALGSAGGPVVGGLIGSVFGLRATFLIGGFFLLLPTPIVIWLVTERRSARTPQPPMAPMKPTEAPRASGPMGSRLLPPLVVLLVAQFLMQATYGAAEQLLALRMLELDLNGAAAATGLAFGAAGLATAIAGATYYRGIRFGRYRPVATIAGLLLGSALVGLSFAPTKPLVMVGFAGVGLVYGVMVPTIASMIGLGASPETQGRVFGISAGVVGIGFGAGPLVGALIASVSGVRVAMLVSAAAAFLAAGVLHWLSGEPAEALGAG